MSKLCSNAANCGIKKIQNALPESLKTKVLQSINISTYVFVMKNKEQTKKLLKFLEDKGLANISIDSKGTTITAQSSSGIINASNDITPGQPGGLGCKAYRRAKNCASFTNQTACSDHYFFNSKGSPPSCVQCKWFKDEKTPCRNGGCSNCPASTLLLRN